jgi:hypothetical protein
LVSGLVDPVGSELLGRPVAERAVGSFGVVLDTPGFDDAATMGDADEPAFVQPLVTEFPVEAFDAGVFVVFAGPDEGNLDAGPVGQLVEQLAVEFGAVVDGDRSRQSGVTARRSSTASSTSPVGAVTANGAF